MKTLVPWRQRNGGFFAPLRQEMEDVFARFFPPLEETGVAQPFMPRVDVEETEKEVLVRVDLPGVDPKDVEINYNEGNLILKGEKKEVHEEKKCNYHRMERFYGQFYRDIPLPVCVNPDKIVATCCKGVITVTIPKKLEAQPKKIVIKPAE